MSVILATAGYDHKIRFWEAPSGICSRIIRHPDSQVNRLEITPDKQFLAAAGNPTIVTVEHDEAAYKFNLCEPDVTESFFRLDNIQTVDGMDKIAMITKNLTEYSPVWPVQGGVPGYLSNGRKVGKTAASDLMQLNLCANPNRNP